MYRIIKFCIDNHIPISIDYGSINRDRVIVSYKHLSIVQEDEDSYIILNGNNYNFMFVNYEETKRVLLNYFEERE